MLHKIECVPVELTCGPTAICAVTGLDPVTVLDACRKMMPRRGNNPIVGMSDHELVTALAYLGFSSVKWITCEQVNFLRFCRFNKAIGKHQIIRTYRHFIAFDGEEMLDNHGMNGKPLHFELSQCKRMIVQHYWIVESVR